MTERTEYQAQQKKPSLWGREPVAIVAAVEACILLAISFGAPITGEQVGLINPALLAVLVLVARPKVTPNANVVERLDRSVEDEEITGVVVAGPANEVVQPGGMIRPQGKGGYVTGQ